MTPKRRRAFDRARQQFAAATAHMTDAEVDAEIAEIVADVRRRSTWRQALRFSDSARSSEVVWRINTRTDQ